MKILITGSAGFVGKVLVPHLQKLGHTIIGIDLQADNNADLAIQQDLRTIDPTTIPSVELCIHLASSVGGFLYNCTQTSIVDYELELLKNIKNIFSAQNCNRIIYTSSINVFEKAKHYPHGPLQQQNYNSPYGQAKYLGEAFIQNHFKEFLILRPTNIFGKSQLCKHHEKTGYSHVIPELLKKIDQNTELEILGDGSQIRNFIHVSDVCKFIELHLHQPKQGWYNLRSNIHISILQLAHELLQYRKVHRPIHFRPEFLKYEANVLPCFAVDELSQSGWQAQINSIQEGLEF